MVTLKSMFFRIRLFEWQGIIPAYRACIDGVDDVEHSLEVFDLLVRGCVWHVHADGMHVLLAREKSV